MPFAESQISDSVEQDTQILTGIACVYNSLSRPLPLSNGRKFRERIAPDAFLSSLEKEDILCTVNHDTSKVLGRKSNGTVEIFNSAERLQVRVRLPKTSYAKDLFESVQRKDINGMSFTFEDNDTEWNPNADDDGLPVCTIKRGNLYEVCFTSDPAYLSTSVTMRDASSIKFMNEPNAGRLVENFNQTLRFNFLRFGIPYRS